MALPPVSDIAFDSVPATPEEFIALRDRIATTPAGGAAMLVLAMQSAGPPEAPLDIPCSPNAVLMRDERLGLICIMLASDMKHVSADPNGFAHLEASIG